MGITSMEVISIAGMATGMAALSITPTKVRTGFFTTDIVGGAIGPMGTVTGMSDTVFGAKVYSGFEV